MKHKYLDKIKSFESPPKKINIFTEKEIKLIQKLYADLPERMFNKKQNIRKKAWIQNYNRDLDQIYFSKLKDVLGDFKMDTLISETGEDFRVLSAQWLTDAVREVINILPPKLKKKRTDNTPLLNLKKLNTQNKECRSKKIINHKKSVGAIIR